MLDPALSSSVQPSPASIAATTPAPEAGVVVRSLPTTAQQLTIAHAISCRGIGLHTGQDVHMRLEPAAPNSGIVFVRADVKDKPNTIRAHVSNVSNTQLCTMLSNESGVSISTVEHLMAACAAMSIDNLRVVVDNVEVPIMDGSSAPFLMLLECAGVVRLDAPKTYIRIVKPVRVECGSAVAELRPSDYGLTIDCSIDFSDAAIGHQQMQFEFTDIGFKTDIARARTFTQLKDHETMVAQGLAKGGSLDNAVVVDQGKILNPDGWRLPQECVRHKILDAVGDLMLLGHAILGHYHCNRPSHKLNVAIGQALLADPSSYVLVTPIIMSAVVPAASPAH